MACAHRFNHLEVCRAPLAVAIHKATNGSSIATGIGITVAMLHIFHRK